MIKIFITNFHLNRLQNSPQIAFKSPSILFNHQLHQSICKIDKKVAYFFASKIESIQEQKQEKKTKVAYYKPTQNYTFQDLQKDLQMYQGYLDIFNTHTKNAHEKLVRNEIKIIELIIDAKREDLLTNFLVKNFKNRLANPETTQKISQYYSKKLSSYHHSIASEPIQCLQFLRTLCLLAEFNQLETFNDFVNLMTLKLGLGPDKKKQILEKVLQKLPSSQCQFLFLYIWLINFKQLPSQLMKDLSLKIPKQLLFSFQEEIFSEISQFLNHYFNNYIQNTSSKFQTLKKPEKQIQKQSSRLEDSVICLLKALNYSKVRKEVLIDKFCVDFVIQGVKHKKMKKILSFPAKDSPYETILQVLGSYHYTAKGKLKGRIMRKLILLGSKYRQRKYHVKLIHYDDFNKSRGLRNKLGLVSFVLQNSGEQINWQAENEGFNQNWVLKEQYDQLR